MSDKKQLTAEGIAKLINAKIEITRVDPKEDSNFIWIEIIKEYAEQWREDAFKNAIKNYSDSLVLYMRDQDENTLYEDYKKQHPL